MSVSYLIKKQTTVTNGDNAGVIHYAGDVISEHDLPQLVREKISEGNYWYTQTFELLNEREAEKFRKKATAVEGKRKAPNGEIIDPPWDDYVGLHPKIVIDRMSNLSYEDAEKVRQYERAKLNRPVIIDYVTPSEREPWYDYDDSGVRDILEKLEILDPQSVQDVIVYEMNHKKRPAILEFEPEEDYTKSDNSEKVSIMVGSEENKE